MEVLFFNLPQVKKEKRNNIWLKVFEVKNRVPLNQTNFQTRISFDEIRDLKVRDANWKSIKFSSKLGAIDSTIKVATAI